MKLRKNCTYTKIALNEAIEIVESTSYPPAFLLRASRSFIGYRVEKTISITQKLLMAEFANYPVD